MKLRNKKTGEIVDYNPTLERWNGPSKEIKHYVSLAELNAEWEDVPEEPKSGIKDVWFPDVIEGENNVVISFETREEAEKAVEKLKAWKRLKDRGFEFCGKGSALDTIKFDYGETGYNTLDFNLLFGGEK